MQDRDDIVVLVDEEGQEHSFEMLDTVDMNGARYAVLLPYSEEEEVDEVAIFKLVEEESGDFTLEIEEDEKILDAVFEEFEQRMSEEVDYVDDEGDE